MMRVQFCAFFRAEVAQLVEHAPEKRGVGSSILPLGTNQTRGARPSPRPDAVRTSARIYFRFAAGERLR